MFDETILTPSMLNGTGVVCIFTYGSIAKLLAKIITTVIVTNSVATVLISIFTKAGEHFAFSAINIRDDTKKILNDA